ncbi:MAG: CDP-alcohol phosphatidyltransferase family protein [Nitrososphaerales archaeon]
MLEKLRKSISPLIEKAGRVAASTGLPPSFWTGLGLVLSVLSALAYARFLPGGPPFAGILLLAAGGLDIIDGAVAKATSRESKSGAFIDSTADRISEVVIFSGIIFGGYTFPLVVLLAVSLSLLTSYARARAEPLGVDLRGVGIAERPERLIILSSFSFFSLVGYAVILIVILEGATFVQRVIVTLKKV